MKFEWESVDNLTDRARVPGGWLVRHHAHVAHGSAGMKTGWDWRVAMAFVPDPNSDWVIDDEEPES
jgi:hypothetical protein